LGIEGADLSAQSTKIIVYGKKKTTGTVVFKLIM
jgi:hypothetical protein